MAQGSLRRYDVQAKYSLVLSVLAVVPMVGAIGLFLRNFRWELGNIVYGKTSSYASMFLAAVAVAAVLGVLGFVLGWSSAGQRRNDKQTRSWIGFFVGGTVVTLSIILLLAFWKLRLQV